MRILTLIAAAALGSLVALSAYAHEFKVGDLEISHPWTRATPHGAKTAAGYLKVTNHGSTPDRLIAASVEFAEVTQIHSMTMDGDVMKMKELTDGLEIPAGTTVELKPHSFHIMFIKMTEQLAVGLTVKGELVFEKAGKVEIEFEVEAADAGGEMNMDMN